jgi:hypothetical protein
MVVGNIYSAGFGPNSEVAIAPRWLGDRRLKPSSFGNSRSRQCPSARSIETARSVPFRELYNSAVGIADVELAAHEDTFLSILFFEDLDTLRGEEDLGILVLFRINFECVMCPAAVLRIAMKRRIALGENDVIVPPRGEKPYRLRARPARASDPKFQYRISGSHRGR